MTINNFESYDIKEHLDNMNKGTHHDGTKVTTETPSNKPTMMAIEGLHQSISEKRT